MLKREAPQIKSGAILSCVHAFACYCPGKGRLLASWRWKLSIGLWRLARHMLAVFGGVE